jgi:hypothetical protein
VLEVGVEYSEIDNAKTRLAQRRKREGTILVSPSADGYSIRHEANSRLNGIAEEILQTLCEDTGEDMPDTRRIEMSEIRSTDARTDFFLGMIDGIQGMTLADVTWVAIHRSVEGSVSDAAGEGGTSGEMPEDDGISEMSPEENMMAGVVKDVVLRGDTLLTSKEYQQLQGRFYLCGMVWDSEETKDNGQKVRFEAEFEDRMNCTGFKYHVRGVFPRSRRSEEDYNKTHRSCSVPEQQQYLTLLEQAATASLESVVSRVNVDAGTSEEE